MKSVLKIMLILFILIAGLNIFLFFPSEELDNLKLETYTYNDTMNVYVITKVDKTSEKEKLDKQVGNMIGNADYDSAEIDTRNPNFTEEKKKIIGEVAEQYNIDPFLIVAIGAEETGFKQDDRESQFGVLKNIYYNNDAKNGTDMYNFRETVEVTCELLNYYNTHYSDTVSKDPLSRTYGILCIYGQGIGNYQKNRGGNDMPYAYPQMMALYSYYKSGNPIGGRDESIFKGAGLVQRGQGTPWYDDNNVLPIINIF